MNHEYVENMQSWNEYSICVLKGQCHKICTPIFHDSNPLGPLCIWWSIFQDLYSHVQKTLCCHWHCWIRLRSVIDTPEASFSLTLTTLNQTPHCHWYPGVKLRNDIDNAESDSAVALIPRSQASQWHWQRKSNMLYLVFFSNLKRHHIILYTFYVSTVTQLDPIFKG